MNVVYTDDALNDLADILNFIAAKYPSTYRAFEMRLHASERRILC